jgi:hypothetical protein
MFVLTIRGLHRLLLRPSGRWTCEVTLGYVKIEEDLCWYPFPRVARTKSFPLCQMQKDCTL